MAWTNDQQKAITESGSNIIVSAGAGSGKTAVLTERIIRKLINGGNINRLLVLTFTNAASAEMKDRIRETIKSNNLKEQLDYLDSSYITTFDSFALSVVKKYHYLLSISNNISIMDSSVEVIKTNEILNEIFLSMYNQSDFKKLIGDFCTKTDDNMKEIIIEFSNKLNVIENKKVYLETYSTRFFNSENIDKYLKQYEELIFNKIRDISNAHDNLISLTDKKYIENFNLEPLINSNTYDTIKYNLNLVGSPRKNNNCEEDYIIYKNIITKELKELKELTRFKDIIDIKESLMSIQSYIDVICKIIIKFDIEFDKYKKEKNLYTFSDIARICINLIKEHEEVREELKNSFDEIMIDEYQDTSDMQEVFINLIANNNLYMVGDIKQSIYRFRHANPYIFKEKYDEYSKGNNGIKIDLLKNFRSRPEVLENINLIFNLVMDNQVGDAEYKENHQMSFGNASYENELKTDNNNNMDIYTYSSDDFSEYKSEEIEAFIVANDIKNKIDNKYQVGDKNGFLRNAEYKDFAIIMDRGTSFNTYKKIFEYVGIPITQIKNEKLTTGDDLTVLSNLINLIIKVNKKEYDEEFKYYFTSISRSFILKLTDEEIFTILKTNDFSSTELFNICSTININELSNLDLLNEIIDKFDYYNKIITTNSIEEREIKLDYLKDLSVTLSEFGYTPIDFSNYLNEMIKSEVIEYSLDNTLTNSVRILNIHKSKGLEYNICYFTGLSKKYNNSDMKSKFIVDDKFKIVVPYLADGIKNTILKDLIVNNYNRDNISERIRLFYVALTRTREKIIIVMPNDNKIEEFDTLVPAQNRLNYVKISDILNSIKPVLKPYIKDITCNIKLTHDYELIKKYNYKTKIEKSTIDIIKKYNDIKYEIINNSKYSNEIKKIITEQEYEYMKKGIQLHYIFETEDFKTTNNPYVLKFLKNINKDYIKIYKEYEFIYDSKHGFIDLMIEYDNYINIIDYKMKNINHEYYLIQLKGYKEYIENITNKKAYIYLYSIIDNKLEEL